MSLLVTIYSTDFCISRILLIVMMYWDFNVKFYSIYHLIQVVRSGNRLLQLTACSIELQFSVTVEH